MRWTSEEIEILRNYSNKKIWLKASELAKMFGRSTTSVTNRRSEMNLHPTKEQRSKLGRPRNRVMVKCPICKEIFETLKTEACRQKYCSKKCYSKGISRQAKRTWRKILRTYSSNVKKLVEQGKKDSDIARELSLTISRVVRIRKILKLYKSPTGGIPIKFTKRKVKCKHCGKWFKESPSKRSKFCSNRCFRQYKRQKAMLEKREERVCQYCREIFKTLPQSTQRFCSTTCWNKSQGLPKVERICFNCGIKYYLNRNSKFCNRSCWLSYQHKKAGKDNEQQKCLRCGKLFRGKCRSMTQIRKFCGKECNIKWIKDKSEERKKEFIRLYKQGLTMIEIAEKLPVSYSTVRRWRLELHLPRSINKRERLSNRYFFNVEKKMFRFLIEKPNICDYIRKLIEADMKKEEKRNENTLIRRNNTLC